MDQKTQKERDLPGWSVHIEPQQGMIAIPDCLELNMLHTGTR